LHLMQFFHGVKVEVFLFKDSLLFFKRIKLLRLILLI
jgi:hypothetical protein